MLEAAFLPEVLAREVLPEGLGGLVRVHRVRYRILVSAWDEFSASLYWAWPFEEAVPVRPGESRLHFSVSYQL